MATMQYKPEEIVGKLGKAEILHSLGMAVVEAIRQLVISEVRCYRWRKEYGWMRGDQIGRLKQIESEGE